ncbi:MAG: phosphoribosylglycinamide formyltransferase [Bacteroidales bacterium]|jgi:phosphoribosylglycinamide formyltransferase-1|nr:phosphoribosylglycinamide formyltransferase [Bacteroidales bacterium]
MKKIALFASGSGTNVENIMSYFVSSKDISVNCVLTNNPDAYVVERAAQWGVDCVIFDREDFYKSEKVLDFLLDREIEFIVLAGFLWLVPEYLIDKFENSIINIHPALLPKYGGKGMYGMNVHRAVKENGDKKTGITIHYVNKEYDKGAVILQKEVEIESSYTPEDIAAAIHTLEYRFFPRTIERVLLPELFPEDDSDLDEESDS